MNSKFTMLGSLMALTVSSTLNVFAKPAQAATQQKINAAAPTGAATEDDKLIASPEASLQDKLAALNRKAGTLKAEKKHQEVKNLYLTALEGENFKMENGSYEILIALGKVFETERDYAKAAQAYERAAGNEVLAKPQRLIALRNYGKALQQTRKYEEARAQFAKIAALPGATPVEQSNALIDIAGVFESEAEYQKAKAEYIKASEVSNLPPGNRKHALAALATFYKNQNDFEGFTKTLATFRQTYGSVDPGILRNYALIAEALAKRDVEESAWSEIIAIPTTQGRGLLEPVSKKIDLLAERKDSAGFKQLVEDLKDKTLMEEQKAHLNLIVWATSTENLSQSTLPSLEPLDAAKQAAALFEAGKVMMRMRSNEKARFFADKGKSIFLPATERIYNFEFVDQAPRGVSGWESSSFIKDEKRRENRFEKYNQQAAALLINDVNIARNVVADQAATEAPISFYMLGDAFGWHIYLQYRDDRAEEVLAGLVGGGELEMYMVPGMRNAYYQFALKVPSGEVNCYPWTSPHKNFRKMDDYLISEVAPIPGGFGVYLCIPWELIYDKLPDNGDSWPFGIVNFGRAGAFTWGSGQVHELSRFGKVKFSGIEKTRPAIERWIAMKAYANYKKSSAHAKLIWNDREKGDTAFFETVLQPEIEKFDKLGELVSSKMSQSDAEKLFREAVPTWMEFDYRVSELRIRYLSDKLMAQ